MAEEDTDGVQDCYHDYGWLVTFGAVALAVALYWFTLPDGMPWGVAGARILEFDLSRWMWVVCALAAGLLGSLVYGYLGWKVGVAASLAWIFAPTVWNGAILGTWGALYASMVVVALWLLNVILLLNTDKVFDAWIASCILSRVTLSNAEAVGWRLFLNRITGWFVLGGALMFVQYSVYSHDYRLGEAASAYARGVVEAAGNRVIVLDGVLDRQVEREVEKIGRGGGEQRMVLSLVKNDDLAMLTLLDWAKREWPDDEALAASARSSVMDFLTLALLRHPERFYLMNGESTTLEQWNRRWGQFGPYLGSSDAFMPVARRYFAYEANAVANRLQEADKAAAWALYRLIVREVDHGNIAALVNMKMMVAEGYSGVTAEEMASVDAGIGEFLGVAYNRRHALELLQAAGPVRRGSDFLATMESMRRWAKQADRRVNVPPEVERMIDLNNEMVKARMDGDREKSERLARQILSNPFWRNWAPANAVMGDLMATQGEYASAVAYYRIATAGHLETPDLVWNNYADALFRIGEYDESEAILRRQIAKTDEKFFALRLTLAELLTKKVKMRGFGEKKLNDAELEALRKETRALVESVQKNAPAKCQEIVRAKQKSGDIL